MSASNSHKSMKQKNTATLHLTLHCISTFRICAHKNCAALWRRRIAEQARSACRRACAQMCVAYLIHIPLVSVSVHGQRGHGAHECISDYARTCASPQTCFTSFQLDRYNGSVGASKPSYAVCPHSRPCSACVFVRPKYIKPIFHHITWISNIKLYTPTLKNGPIE